MLTKLPGKKVGMTQLFDKNRNVIPVTVIRVADWFVTQVKTEEKDGYAALQLGLLRNRYQGTPFNPEWLRTKKEYFLHVREVPLTTENAASFTVGQQITLDNTVFDVAQVVDVTGNSIGLGFQGVMKRHGFSGGPKSHGSRFHRRPGSLGNMRTQGEVLKGKKLPGHCGTDQVTVRGLELVQVDKATGHIFVKGAVPGKRDTLLMIRKQG